MDIRAHCRGKCLTKVSPKAEVKVLSHPANSNKNNSSPVRWVKDLARKG